MSYQVKIFDYIPELDAFIPTKEYKGIAEQLGLVEWNYVAWIGCLFSLDNDFGEHWFDNWDLRKKIHNKAEELGYNSEALYIIDPKRLQDGRDGACHTDEERKRFWTDVLKSLSLSLDTLFLIALQNNPPVGEEAHLPIKKRIKELSIKYSKYDILDRESKPRN